MAWAGIVLASIIWRVFLSQAFSLPAVRRAYGRMQRVASRVIGAIIGVFALTPDLRRGDAAVSR